MIGSVFSAAVLGVDGCPLRVEVDISNGLPVFEIVGLPDAAVREARERVKSAIRNSECQFPSHRVTVNLSPARLRKEGSALDLPLAIAVLAASGQLPGLNCARLAFLGELSLDGTLRPVTGVLPAAAALTKAGVRELVVPKENAREAGLVGGLTVRAAGTLSEVIHGLLCGDWATGPTADPCRRTDRAIGGQPPDFESIHGQNVAKRAVEIAAAGAHHLLLTGPPGTGKTMLARAMAGILPPLTEAEALTVSTVASVAGLLHDGEYVRTRPFRAPHHTTSASAMVGGGPRPAPGEISLAHAGVLFLDELPEFRRDALEALREPLESGSLTIQRGGVSARFPARFSLVASMNPCPCGRRGDADAVCTCTPLQVQRYLGKLSGPLFDRIDLVVNVGRMTYDDLTGGGEREQSASVAARVAACRERQSRRYRGREWQTNGTLPAAALRQFCEVDAGGVSLVAAAFERLRLSNRAHDRIIRVARTVADLAGEERIGQAHIAEAIQFCAGEALA